MERFEHGGNIYRHKDVLDFSANLNPLGMPASAKNALVASVDAFEAYPDPDCHELARAIAAFEGVDAEYVLPCAGATDAFTRLCLSVARHAASGKVLVCAPCYSGYEQAAEQAGFTVGRHNLSVADGLGVTESILPRLDAGYDMVFLANPNNPTGLLIDDSLLSDILEAADEAGTLVVLDECFVDLVLPTEDDGVDLEALASAFDEGITATAAGARSNSYLDAFPNLVIVKALTKTFALAGLRVGYALCSDEELLDDMRTAGQPWAVSVPAQVAGVAALQERDYVAQAQQLVAAERKRLAAALEEAGFDVIPGQANYLLFNVPRDGRLAHPLFQLFLERGILIRSCTNYQGLGGSWYRIAVRTPEENDQFIAALKEVCA